MSGPEPKYGTVVQRTFADTPNPELIEVTQADRDMAADYWMPPPNSSIDHLPWVRRANAAREGRSDDDALIQAFAHHRLNTRPTPPLPDIEGLVERVEKLLAAAKEPRPKVMPKPGGLKGGFTHAEHNALADWTYRLSVARRDIAEQVPVLLVAIESLASSNEAMRVVLGELLAVEALETVATNWEERNQQWNAALRRAREAYLGEDGK